MIPDIVGNSISRPDRKGSRVRTVSEVGKWTVSLEEKSEKELLHSGTYL